MGKVKELFRSSLNVHSALGMDMAFYIPLIYGTFECLNFPEKLFLDSPPPPPRPQALGTVSLNYNLLPQMAKKKNESISHSVMSDSLQPCGL